MGDDYPIAKGYYDKISKLMVYMYTTSYKDTTTYEYIIFPYCFMLDSKSSNRDCDCIYITHVFFEKLCWKLYLTN